MILKKGVLPKLLKEAVEISDIYEECIDGFSARLCIVTQNGIIYIDCFTDVDNGEEFAISLEDGDGEAK